MLHTVLTHFNVHVKVEFKGEKNILENISYIKCIHGIFGAGTL